MQHITVTDRQTDNSSLLHTTNRLIQQQFHWLSPDFCHYTTVHQMLNSHRSTQKITTTYVINIQTRELCIWQQYIVSSRRPQAIVQCAYNMGSEIHVCINNSASVSHPVEFWIHFLWNQNSPACHWYSQCSVMTQINSVNSGSQQSTSYHRPRDSNTRYAPAIGSLTSGRSTSIRGQVLSLHMAKLQAASVPIGYGSWDRQTEGSQYLLKPCSLQRGYKNAMRNCSSSSDSLIPAVH